MDDLDEFDKMIQILDIKQEKAKSLMQQYRPEKVLSVSDLIKPLYCEVQHEYQLLTGQRIETEQMKQGTEFHLQLELEVHDIVQIDVDTLEDKWAIRLLNLQLAIQMLLSTGRAREVPVFGYVDNDAVLVRGVIDELRMDEDSQTITIIDHKTRSSNYLPSESQVNQTKFQLMMYKQLLLQLIENAHDLAQFTSRLHLDNNKQLNTQVQDHIQSMGLGMQSYTLSGIFGILSGSLSIIQNHSHELQIIYHFSNAQTQNVQITEDLKQLQKWLQSSLEFWKSLRRPQGVCDQDCWKCQSCPYKDICWWRQIQHLQHISREN